MAGILIRRVCLASVVKGRVVTLLSLYIIKAFDVNM